MTNRRPAKKKGFFLFRLFNSRRPERNPFPSRHPEPASSLSRHSEGTPEESRPGEQPRNEILRLKAQDDGEKKPQDNEVRKPQDDEKLVITKQKINQYLDQLKSQGSSKATLKRKEASLAKFAEWVKREYGQEEEALKVSWLPGPKSSPPPQAYNIPKKTPPIFKYFSFLIIILLTGALGWGVYSQFIAQPPEEPSLAALPTLPPNLISFQGRLTNTVGTPIHATISATFKIYNVDTGGTALWSETKDITTNADGIFNTLLGSSTPIDPSIFANNVNLWLGITVGGDGEMTPRQQIATVGYAYNSRYLQGYPATTSATAETIPVINASGDLILAAASPAIESISGTFGLKGEAITIQSTGGVGGGDILIQPDTDTQGQVIVYSGTTTDNSFTVQNSNITTGSLIYAEASTSATGYNLLKLSSGSTLTDKFVVDWAGNTDITGNLTVDSSGSFGGNVGVGTTAPASPLSVGASSQFQVDSNGDIVKLKNLTYSWPSAHTTDGFLKNDGFGGLVWTTDITASALRWNALIDPNANLSLNHNEYTSTFTWDTALTAEAFTGLTLALTNDATTDANTQRVLALQNNSAVGGTTENLLYLNNADNNIVTAAIEIGNTGGGGFTNFLNTPSIDITGTGAITGATGITSSGTITFSGLTADRLVTTTTGGQLTNSISSANLATSVTDETGTAGKLVFSTSPTFSTSVLTDSASFSVFNTTATTLNAFGAATALNLGANSGTATIGNPTIAGTQTTQNLWNTTATTINFAGASTSLNLGATTGTTTIKNPTLALSADSTILNFSSLTGAKQIQTGGTTDLALMPGGNVGIGTTAPASPLSVGASSQFQVDSNGDIVKLKNLTYSWPSTHVTDGFLKNDGLGNLVWTTEITANALKWNSLINPDGNLSLSMGAYTTTFTWGATTGANNLFTLADTANNTGTGYLLNIATATGSTLKPLRIASAGVEALAVNAAGNVGIGTTAPQQKLTLSSGSNFATEMATPGTPTLTCNTTGGTLADGTYYYKIVASDGGGTTTAGSANSCTITGGAGAGSVSISWSAITGASSYRVYGRDTSYGQYWTSSTTSYTDTGTAGTSGTPPTVTTAYINKITASGNSWLLGGNVGIGTANIDVNLVVGGSANGTAIGINNISTGGDEWYLQSIGNASGRVGHFEIANGGAISDIRLTIDGSGNVGIGTTVPQAKLQVDADAGGKGILVNSGETDMAIRVVGESGSTKSALYASYTGHTGTGLDAIASLNQYTTGSGDVLSVRNDGTGRSLYVDTNGGGYAAIFDGGNVGIGTTSPGYRLDISGGTDVVAQFSGRVIGGEAVNNNEFITKGQLGSVGVTSVTGTANQITAFPTVGDVVLSIPADFRAPGTITATTGLYTGAGAGTLRLDANGALSNITSLTLSGAISGGTTYSGSGNITSSGGVLFMGGTGNNYFAGNVGIGHTSPTFKLQIAGSGNLLSIGNTAGETLFSVTDSQITSNLPHTFTSSGDVSMAYDLYFTNQASSKIESYGPFSIIAGESHESNNLTLKTYNAGKLIVDSANFWVDSTNVGIGTTNPVQKLHVEGQCVTGDTLLPLVRKITNPKIQISNKSQIQNSNDQNGLEFRSLDISACLELGACNLVLTRIDQVKEEDYVLSLNETTNKIEPHRVKGLLDMGVQPVFKLTTEDGRTIRTTGNHPYLTKDGWTKVVYLQEGEEIAVMGTSFNSSVDVSPVTNESNQNFSLQPVKNNPIITDSESVDLTGNPTQSFCKEKGVGGGKEGFNLFDNPFLNGQREFSQISFCMFGEAVGNHNPKRFLTEAEETRPEEREFSSFSKKVEERLSNSSSNSFKASASRNNPTDLDFLSTKRTTPLRYSAGEERNFDNETVSSLRNTEIIYSNYTTWQKIKSIEYVGYEQVYDIEVEGTHNFVANGILAHNTYISGDVGIGTTSPTSLLSVGASSQFQVDSSGDIVKLKNLTYSWPSSHTADGFLKDDGSGNLAWTTIAGAGGVTGTGTAGQATFWTGTSTVSGDNAFWWDNTNKRLGIGTTVPTMTLDIRGDATSSGTIHAYTAMKSAIFVDTANDSYYLDPANGTTSLTVAGNVGIGTASPNFKLDVAGNAAVRNNFYMIGAYSIFQDNQAIFQAKNAGGTYETWMWPRWSDNVMYTNFGSGGWHIRNNSSATVMFMQNGGNVGIGTTGPGSKLEVTGHIELTNQSYDLWWDNSSDAAYDLRLENAYDYDGWFRVTDGGGVTRFAVGRNNQAYIGGVGGTGALVWHSGNDGSGSGLDADLLDGYHYSSSWPNPSNMLTGSGTANYVSKWTGTYTQGNSTIYDNGNVGIGTTAPSQKLDVNGQIALSGYNSSWPVEIYQNANSSLMVNGYLYVGARVAGTTAVCWNGNYGLGTCSSDERLKNNIVTIPNALEKISKLRGVNFTWKDDPNNELTLGLIAQEVATVIPEAVYSFELENNGSFSTYYGVRYGELAGLLIEGIKEQQEEINTNVEALTSLNSDLSLNEENILITNRMENGNYQVQNNSLKKTITRVSNFHKVFTGNIEAGLIEAKQITTENLLTDNIHNKEKIISPLVEAEQIQFQNQNAKIKMQNDNAKLKIVNSTDQPIAEFDTENKKTTLFGDLEVERGLKSATAKIGMVTGEKANFENLISATAEIDSLTSTTAEVGQISAQEASFGDLLAENVGIGQLEAESVKTENLEVTQGVYTESLQARSATISGTLYVDRVVAREGGFGDLLAKDISMESVRAIVREEINKTQDLTGKEESTPETTGSIQNDGSSSRHSEGTPEESGDPSRTGSFADAQDDGKKEEEVDIEALLAEVESWLNLNTDSNLPVDEDTALSEDQVTSFAEKLVHNGDLDISGQANINNLVVGSLNLADNNISNPNGTLYLQKEGLGGLDILNGKIAIDTGGNVFIAQHLTVGGNLIASNIRPNEKTDLVFDLANDGSSLSRHSEGTPEESGDPSRTGSFANAQDDGGQGENDTDDTNGNTNNTEGTLGRTGSESGFGKLLVKGISQETVAQIDASGSAEFAGTVKADSLAISKPENNQEGVVIAASDNFDKINIWAPGIVTNASAGEAVLPVGQTDLVVYNDRLTGSSMVYLTPTSDTQNQVLYVKAKITQNNAEKESQKNAEIGPESEAGTTSKNYFVVGINQPISEEVKFNWWIIQ